MPGPFVGALDQGTTSTRFIVFDRERNPIAVHRIEHEQITPQAGWLSHNPNQIAENALECVRKAVEKFQAAEGQDARVEAMGITNQRETTVAWDANSGAPLCHAIVWSDARTAEIAEELAQGDPSRLRAICGLPFSTYFSGVKMAWMLRNEPAVRRAAETGSLRFGTMDSWLIWRLTGGAKFVTDCTNASRTMLMDISTLKWSAEACDALGVPMSALAQIVSCSEYIADVPVGGDATHPPIPLTGCIGDQQGALVGNLCFKRGAAKNTYGTGCFLLCNVGTVVPPPSKSGLLSTVGYRFGDDAPHYAYEGAVAGAGSTVQWLRDRLGIIRDLKESGTLAASVPDAGGVVFVPAFGGLLAPYWRPDARGTIVGMSQHTTKAHITRAVFDAIAQQVSILVGSMEREAGIMCTVLAVDGGMVANKVLVQEQADALGAPVRVPSMLETTAAGAAICASLPKKLWGDIKDMHAEGTTREISPRTTPEQRQRRRVLWSSAVERSLGWSKL